MYKFLIKASGSYKFYQVKKVVTNAEGKEVEIMADYETDDLEELSIKYKELLEKYSIATILPIHVLKTELKTEITEE